MNSLISSKVKFIYFKIWGSIKIFLFQKIKLTKTGKKIKFIKIRPIDNYYKSQYIKHIKRKEDKNQQIVNLKRDVRVGETYEIQFCEKRYPSVIVFLRYRIKSMET